MSRPCHKRAKLINVVLKKGQVDKGHVMMGKLSKVKSKEAGKRFKECQVDKGHVKRSLIKK